MPEHRVGTQEEWQAERDELLAKEKELTRLNDELAERRRELPWGAGGNADTLDPNAVHLRARDVTLICSSRAPLEKLIGYRDRMGWSFNWVSTVGSDFHRDLGFLHTEEELKPFLEGEMPPAVEQYAKACGVDAAAYVTEGPGLSTYIKSDGVVYRTYVTTARGLEPAMAYYGLLDRTPMGRNEEGETDFWLRRHDEYETA